MEMEDKEGANKSGNWAELTQVCLINILSRLSLPDRWRGAMRVCKSWLQACKDPYLNSLFDIETQFNSATELPRYWTPDFERKIDSMLRSVVLWSDGSLHTIRVRHCSDYSLALVAERSPKLQVLSIKSSPHVTDEIMCNIGSQCPLLRELDISFCYEISHKTLSLIGNHCPNLQILRRNFMNWLDPSQHVCVVPKEYLDACPQDDDLEVVSIGKFMPQLLHLELQFSKLTNKGLNLISEGCTNLEHLDLYGCANITSRGISNASLNLKKLKTMKKPNFYIPRSVFHTERYGHWQLYDERFQTDVFSHLIRHYGD